MPACPFISILDERILCARRPSIQLQCALNQPTIVFSIPQDYHSGTISPLWGSSELQDLRGPFQAWFQPSAERYFFFFFIDDFRPAGRKSSIKMGEVPCCRRQ
jgi:hypothetical protein